MITCRDCVDFLMEWDAGRLPPAQKAEFERHLTACPPCVAYIESYRTAIALGKAACCDEDAAEPLPEALVSAILKARAVKPAPKSKSTLKSKPAPKRKPAPKAGPAARKPRPAGRAHRGKR